MVRQAPPARAAAPGRPRRTRHAAAPRPATPPGLRPGLTGGLAGDVVASVADGTSGCAAAAGEGSAVPSVTCNTAVASGVISTAASPSSPPAASACANGRAAPCRWRAVQRRAAPPHPAPASHARSPACRPRSTSAAAQTAPGPRHGPEKRSYAPRLTPRSPKSAPTPPTKAANLVSCRPRRKVGVGSRLRYRYGTLICDLERRRTIALLPDREPATAQAWLSGQPQIEIVSRDRGGAYALAAARALPEVVQVADRWHLTENASQAFLAATRACMRQARAAVGAATVEASAACPAREVSDYRADPSFLRTQVPLLRPLPRGEPERLAGTVGSEMPAFERVSLARPSHPEGLATVKLHCS